MITIVEAVKNHAAETPEKAAIVCEGRKTTYSDLWKKVRGFAAYLNKFGLEKGSRIIVKAIPDEATLIAYLGIHLSGNINVPVEKTIGGDGLAEIAQQLTASVIISDESADGYRFIAHDDILKLCEESFNENDEFEFPALTDRGDILFTTGTTGKSKGVIQLHRTISYGADNFMTGSEFFDGLIYLIPVPINHANGIRKCYSNLLFGTTIVLLDGLSNLKKFYEVLELSKANYLLLPPAAVRIILMLSAKELVKYADQIKAVHTSAAPFPESDKEKLAELLPDAKLFFGYGSSESSSSAMLNYAKYPGRLCCVGKPNRNTEVLIVDDNRNVIKSSADNQGLVALKGPVNMEGYYNAPEMTAEVMVDGIVYTNDIGYIDEDGFLYVLGRKGDVINVGGLKVAPTEVESVVMHFPGIAECAVFGIDDRMTGKAPKLNIVPERRAQIDINELREFLASRLESYKIPKKVEIVAEIPKTSNGKINRKELK